MKKILSHKIANDDFVKKVSEVFDYEVKDTVETEVYTSIDAPKDFAIGLIVGPSGSGKSQLLTEFGPQVSPAWVRNKAIVSHFQSPDEAIEMLGAVGLNTIPSWVKPYGILSTGEKFRADLARTLKSGAVVDEFTSVVDRNVARATSASVSRYIRKNKLKNIVFASCHTDIAEWLEPDWVFNTLTGELSVGRMLRRRQEIKISIYEGHWKHWEIFKKFHYLDAKINKSARCYLAFWGGALVGFVAVLTMPNGYVKNAYRAHRTVILPDFQGLGLGVKLSDNVAQIYVNEGKRYFSRTAHPRMGIHRDNSPLWKPTSKNRKLRTDVKHLNVFNNHFADNKRTCWSHEYIGSKVL